MFPKVPVGLHVWEQSKDQAHMFAIARELDALIGDQREKALVGAT